MSDIVNTILNSIDLTLMLTTNVITYFVIKILDELNGDNIVSTNTRRLISLISAILVATIVILIEQDGNYVKTFYSCILSLASWDLLFKPIIEKYKIIDYKE